MQFLVTGSAGHLGEALVRTLRDAGKNVTGLDLKPSAYTDHVGSIVNREFVHDAVKNVDAVFHTATLHKPHVGTHSRQAFVDTNITGTLNLLEESVASGCKAFIYTSTTSAFGDAMRPLKDGPAIWVDETLQPLPKNIYGATKTAAEDLCKLFHRNTGLPCIVLRTSRFFPEEDDRADRREGFSDANLKVNELLNRRADIEDIVSAHLLAARKADAIGFDRFIISATSPFKHSDGNALNVDALSVLKNYVPEFEDVYAQRNWKMHASIDRVYDNTHARTVLGWAPEHNFDSVIDRLSKGGDHRSKLAIAIGSRGYHETRFEDGPYPVGSF